MKIIDEQIETERQLVAAVARISEVIILDQKPIIPAIAPSGHEYVDPYLFETGHFKDYVEYGELSRTAKITPRAKA